MNKESKESNYDPEALDVNTRKIFYGIVDFNHITTDRINRKRYYDIKRKSDPVLGKQLIPQQLFVCIKSLIQQEEITKKEKFREFLGYHKKSIWENVAKFEDKADIDGKEFYYPRRPTRKTWTNFFSQSAEYLGFADLKPLVIKVLEYCTKEGCTIPALEEYGDIIKKLVPAYLEASFLDKKNHTEISDADKQSNDSEGMKSEKPQTNTKHYLTSTSDWLSPLNDTYIPFVGREEELEKLDAFAEGKSDTQSNFELWAMIGPSGAGKTRLLVHWANNHGTLKDWDVTEIKPNTAIDWPNWHPKRSTLISIDYIYGYDKVISAIIERAREITKEGGFIHPVRLLLLEHAAPNSMAEFLKDPRWGVEHRGAEFLNVAESQFFFESSPLKIEVLDDQDGDNLLLKIICAVAYHRENDPFSRKDEPVIQRGLKYLKEMEETRQPLFAALVGDAIRNSDKDNKEGYLSLNRRALIKNYLQGQTRCTWLMEDRKKGTWAACFVAAATARRGAKFNTLTNALSKEDRDAIGDYKKFKSLCNSVVSGNNTKTLKAFEPDILGETHFLLLLKEIDENPFYFEDKLHSLIAEEVQGGADNSASEFIAFMTRLVRNLSSDDQRYEDTKKYWELLEQFLRPENFPENNPFRWAVSMACFESYLILKEREQAQLADIFLNNVDEKNLYVLPKEQVTSRHIGLIIKISVLKQKGVETIPPALLELLEWWDNGKECDYSALMISIWADCPAIINFLVDREMNLDFVGRDGLTALMLACGYGREKAALKLIAKDAALDAKDDNNCTALMFACRYGQEQAALELIAKDAALEVQSDEQWTALMVACRHNQESVALKLIEKDANLEAQNNKKLTALMFACYYSQEQAALELIAKDAALEVQSDEQLTALMIACQHNQKLVALKLIEKNANLDARDHGKRTALMFACRYDQESVALKLIEKSANLKAECHDKSTALMIACRYSQESVALKLVEKNANLEAQSNTGANALIFATFYRKKYVIEALLNKKVNTDSTVEYDGVEFTALGLARDLGYEDIIGMLEKAGALELPAYNLGS